MHVCPMVTPGTPPIPHVGGPVVGPGCPTVLIGGMPAAVMGDMCTCVGPPDSIVLGSTGVMIGNKPAARMGDMCAHGGSIVVGCPTVLIGEMSPGSPPPPPVINMLMLSSASASSDHAQKTAQVVALKRAAESGAPFCEKCEAARRAKEEEEEEAKERKYHRAQFRAVDEKLGEPVEGLPYAITLPSGIVYSGRTDEEGYTTVITTVDAQEAEVEWLPTDLVDDSNTSADPEGCY